MMALPYQAVQRSGVSRAANTTRPGADRVGEAGSLVVTGCGDPALRAFVPQFPEIADDQVSTFGFRVASGRHARIVEPSGLLSRMTSATRPDHPDVDGRGAPQAGMTRPTGVARVAEMGEV